MARYAVAPERIVVVEPGTDRVPLAHGSRGRVIELLTVATLNPGKGHELLLEALSVIEAPAWRLTCAGSLTRDPATAARVRAVAARLQLEERVAFVGDLDRDALAARYDGADVAVLATRQETYGMAVAEALAYGLPVVATSTGAIPQLVGEDAGLLVPVGDRNALAQALTRVIGDAALRQRLAEGARRRRDRLPTWEDAARRMATAPERLCRVHAGGCLHAGALAALARARRHGRASARTDAGNRHPSAPGQAASRAGSGNGHRLQYPLSRQTASQSPAMARRRPQRCPACESPRHRHRR